MAWLGVGRHLTLDQSEELARLSPAALLFLFSDSINALKRFRKPFRAAEVLTLAPYFAAQLLIALSI